MTSLGEEKKLINVEPYCNLDVLELALNLHQKRTFLSIPIN